MSNKTYRSTESKEVKKLWSKLMSGSELKFLLIPLFGTPYKWFVVALYNCTKKHQSLTQETENLHHLIYDNFVLVHLAERN